MNIKENSRELHETSCQPIDAFTFNNMLDTSTGNLPQRVIKAWIKPADPEGTVKLLEQMQVDHFLNFALRAYYFATNIGQSERIRASTNYEMPDSTLTSMVNFATNMTTFNELLHLSVLAINGSSFLANITKENPNPTSIVILGTAMAINTYCALAQRYTRAKLSLTIDKALKRNKKVNELRYKNYLDIRTHLDVPDLADSTDPVST
jgi:hypothetical protein